MSDSTPILPQTTGKTVTQRVALFAGPALFTVLLLIGAPEGLSREGWVVVALLSLMAVWWITEAIPIPITSLLPLVVLPMFGVRTIQEASTPYADRIIMLLLGGFIIAKSVERWHLHERLALLTVRRAGAKPEGLVLGFLLASALLSGWISNTATSIMLMPVALSVAQSLGAKPKAGTPLAVALCLAVAYGASIGGLATPVGTPTNLIVIGALEQAGDDRLDFARWMIFGVPTVLVLLPLAWLVLTKLSGPIGKPEGNPQEVVRERLAALGAWSTPEIRTMIVFSIIAFFWIFRRAFLQDLSVFGFQPFAGLTDHVIAIAGAIAMFLVPAGCPNDRGAMLLDWPTAKNIPWDVVLLFGGGLSVASAMTATGLGGYIAGGMGGLMSLPQLLVIGVFAIAVIFWTEVTSNVATAAALMPVVIAIAAGAGIDPAGLAIPVALAASCAFMFPMATAPNAIAFASGEVSIARMAKVGVRLNLLAAVAITLIATFLTPLVLS
ncbi:SLC13/DASS family transporter [Parvularcula sp. ZS-1/3]|uniref:SLC13/DASS family transporter n=1 Tax=Parvularcula mediterranea TaxID=2732508 RepID=A0A7Y3RM04_9PROT|nr:SLC13 family permease [Parvularcula mediterranea]NNU16548.1 SLC13/DASS family transporter [Parvularcula mediterranea]